MLGERLSELLDRNGFTQKQLSNLVGVTEVTVSRYIKGTRCPRGTILAKMAEALHTTPEYLLNREADEDPELSFNRTRRAVIRNAQKWTPKQKAELVNILFLGDAYPDA